MSSDEDREKRRRRLRNKYAKELAKPKYHQRVINNKKKKNYDDDAYEQD